MKVMVKGIAVNAWLLTFGDVITLLICFFVMMLAINKGEVGRVHQWVGSEIEASYHQAKSAIEAQGMKGVSVSLDNQGILLSIDTSEGFASAKAEPNDELVEKIDYIAQLLEKLPIFTVKERYPTLMQQAHDAGLDWVSELKIEGHTDNDVMQATSRYHSNWELSAMRAQRVMMLLMQQTHLPSSVFSIAGKAEYHPLVANDTEEHKAKNRRIDIRINAALIQQTHAR